MMDAAVRGLPQNGSRTSVVRPSQVDPAAVPKAETRACSMTNKSISASPSLASRDPTNSPQQS